MTKKKRKKKKKKRRRRCCPSKTTRKIKRRRKRQPRNGTRASKSMSNNNNKYNLLRDRLSKAVAFVFFETDESYFAEQTKRVFFYREKEKMRAYKRRRRIIIIMIATAAITIEVVVAIAIMSLTSKLERELYELKKTFETKRRENETLSGALMEVTNEVKQIDHETSEMYEKSAKLAELSNLNYASQQV